MVIEPVATHDGQWIIVSNPRSVTAGGVRVNVGQPEPVTLAWDWCWTSEGWALAADRAQKFASHEAAQRYIGEQSELLVAAYEAASD